MSRAPEPEERQRDAARSRQRLLAAALDEFAAKGYAGARVKDIADRAGLNKQLITYYFGGKQGLAQALREQWLEQEATFVDPGVPLDELVSRYLEVAMADPRSGRLLVWEGLTGEPGPPPAHDEVADLRRRQAQGELAADLDPAYVQLVLMGAAVAATALPQVARRLTGRDVDDPEFQRRYREQVRRIVRRLAD